MVCHSNSQGHRRNWKDDPWPEFRNHLGRRRAHTTSFPHPGISHQWTICCQVWHTGPAWPGWRHLKSFHCFQSSLRELSAVLGWPTNWRTESWLLQNSSLLPRWVLQIFIFAQIGCFNSISSGCWGWVGWWGEGRKNTIRGFPALQFRSPW